MFKRIGGRGEVAAIRGPSGVSFVDDEKKGFYRALKKFPKIKVVFDQNAKQFTASEGLRLAQDALTAHPNLKAIFTEGDDLAIGIVRAMRDRGSKLVLAGSDGLPATFDLVVKGEMTILVSFPTYKWGLDAMKIAHDFLVLHRRPPDRVLAPLVVATPENARKIVATTCSQRPHELFCQGRR
jgi:ABC-type sugar transport system substrate-binding protein